MTPKEIAAKEALITSIHAHSSEIGTNGNGVITYRFDEVVITLSPGKEKLKVKSVSEGEEEEE